MSCTVTERSVIEWVCFMMVCAVLYCPGLKVERLVKIVRKYLIVIETVMLMCDKYDNNDVR